MPIDFPDSPANGDTFTSSGRTWEFDGVSWIAKLATPSVASGSITVDKLADDAVHTAKIAAGAVTSAKIAAGSITATEIGTGAVTAGKIDSLAVTTGKLAADSVTEAKIAAGAVSTAKIADGSVTSAKIADGTIMNADINSLASISLTKLAGNGIAQMMVNNDTGYPQYRTISGDWTMSSLGVATISNGAVSQAKLDSTLSGITICTSTTRPTSPFIGQAIFETNTGRMKFWLGSSWSTGTVHGLDGSSADTAAPSASFLAVNFGTTTSGYYWIKPTGFATARQVWCDMSNSGGGWMLMSFTGTGNSSGSHVIDSYSGSAFNMGSTATSINSTSQAAGSAGNLGQDFINALVTNGRGNGVALFRVDNTNWYFTVNSTASWNPISQRLTTTAGNRTLASNDWLKTTYTGYSVGNAGTVSGTSYAAGTAYWNTYPGNFDTHASNWGYSIDPYYNGYSGNAWTNWLSAHSNGWDKTASFWLKIGA